MKQLLVIGLLLFVLVPAVYGQENPNPADLPDPKVAFLKSMAVPGWGHHYVDQDNWARGQYHLAAEAALILSYFGLRVHTNNLRQNWYAYGRGEAGVIIEDRSRRFQLAVGDFDNLQAYNDYQLRNRNWDQLFEDVPQNRWNWSTDQERLRYKDLRNRFEQIDQQLPALLAMMAVNRVISGISAYNRAQKKQANSVTRAVYLSRYQSSSGIVANVRISF